MKVFRLLLIALLFVAGHSHAATIAASSCSQTHVQSAIDSATADDIVSVPAGNCTWSSGVSITKGITVQGSGDSTVINNSGATLFDINGNGSGAYRVTSMKFTGSGGKEVNIRGSWSTVRVDNITWQTGTAMPVEISNAVMIAITRDGFNLPGQKILFDNIRYTQQTTSAGHPFLKMWGRGHLAWQEPDGFGSDNFLYIEDSTFNYALKAYNVTDTEAGGRFVFRRNTVYNAGIYMHDLGSTQRARGNRAVEVYDNIMSCTLVGCSSVPGMNTTRGGTGIFFRNTLTGYASNMYTWPMIYRVYYDGSFIGGGRCADTGSRKVCQDVHARCIGGTNDKKPCTPWGGCPGGTCSTDFACNTNADCLDWQGNSSLCMQLDGGSASSGWPCRDQAGRGMDDPSTGVQASSPIYFFNNTVDGVVNKPMLVGGSYTFYIQRNRDYYDDTLPFNGSTGVGSGTLANRPSTCTTGVGYWATDQGNWNKSSSGGQGVLYKCTSTNTWTTYYTPYE